jgi:phasin family protein
MLQCSIVYEINKFLVRRMAAGEACKTEWRFDMTQKRKSAPASTQGYEEVVEMTKDQVEKASMAALKGYDDFAAFNKESADAFTKASNVWAKGFEAVGKAYFDFAQNSAQESVEVAKTIMGAKTIADVVDAQSAFAKSSFDKGVAESTRLSGMSMKIANEATAPIQAQFSAAAEKFVKSAA